MPAKDEEALLPRLIAALGRQSVLPRLPAPLEVVVVLNNTSDRSREVAAAAAALSPQLRLTVIETHYPPDRAHVGSARRAAMEHAAGMAGPEGVILTTDADAVPSDRWIEANLDAIVSGADLVGGRILGDPEEEAALGPGFLRRARLHAEYARLRDELAALIDPLPHDPWPRHQDHTGGSLAVRAAVYARVGGISPLPFREDLAFVSKVRAAGYRLVHPLDVVVTVSARTRGRAKGGMADCLTAWLREEAEGLPVLVEAPTAVEARLRRRKALRDLALAPSAGSPSMTIPSTLICRTTDFRSRETVFWSGGRTLWSRSKGERNRAVPCGLPRRPWPRRAILPLDEMSASLKANGGLGWWRRG